MAGIRKRLNQDEKAQQRLLEAREKQANKILADPEKSIGTKEDARRALKNIARDRAKLEEQIAARVGAQREKADASEAENLLSQMEAEFPAIKSTRNWAAIINGDSNTQKESTPTLTVEELETQLARVRNRLEGLVETAATRPARIYLMDQSNSLHALLVTAKEAERERQRLAKQEQADRDTAAGQAAVREWCEKFDTRLASGFLPLPEREAIRANCLKVAAEYRAKQREAGNKIENGVHVAVILAAKAEFFEQAANRLTIYDCDLENPAPINESDEELFESRLAISPAYFNFRTRDEQAKLAWRAKRYFQSTNNWVGLSQVPHVPDPIVVAKKPPVPLELIEYRNTEQLFNALKPLDDGQSLEVIYRCPTATLDNPNSPPEFYWPNGELVDMHRDVIWDKKIQKFRRPPEPAGLAPKWGGARRTEWVQDPMGGGDPMRAGEWVKQAVNDTAEEVEQDSTGSFVSRPTGQLKQGPIVEIQEGPHRPDKNDPRRFFRSGHFWTKEDIEQANLVSFNLKMLPSGQPAVVDQSLWNSPDTAEMTPEESANCWRRRTAELREAQKPN